MYQTDEFLIESYSCHQAFIKSPEEDKYFSVSFTKHSRSTANSYWKPIHKIFCQFLFGKLATTIGSDGIIGVIFSYYFPVIGWTSGSLTTNDEKFLNSIFKLYSSFE